MCKLFKIGTRPLLLSLIHLPSELQAPNVWGFGAGDTDPFWLLWPSVEWRAPLCPATTGPSQVGRHRRTHLHGFAALSGRSQAQQVETEGTAPTPSRNNDLNMKSYKCHHHSRSNDHRLQSLDGKSQSAQSAVAAWFSVIPMPCSPAIYPLDCPFLNGSHMSFAKLC